jgi:DHA2 family multidrug resistance protein
MTPRQWLIVITASIGAMLEVVDVSITNVSLVHIQANLSASLAEVGWVVTGYAMASVVVIPLSNWLTAIFGQKTYFILALLGFTAASVLCGLAANLPLLVLARILQGLLGGGLMPMAQAIMYRAVPREQQGIAQGIFGTVILAGPALGPTIGGLLTDSLGWRWVFFINVPLGLLTAFVANRVFPADQRAQGLEKGLGKGLDKGDRRQPGVDWLGIGLLVLGLACLQVVLEQGRQYDWFENQGLRLLALGAALALPAFVFWELRQPQPAVDLRVLRHRSLAAGSAFSFLLGAGLYGTVLMVPIFAQRVLQFTATQTGLLMLPGALASAVAMALLGKNAHRLDPRWLIALGAGLMVATMMQLSAIGPDTGEHSLYWPLIQRGCTTVMMFLPLTLVSLGSLPKSEVGSGSGFFNLSRQLGGSFGVAGFTLVLDHQQAVHHAQLVQQISNNNPLIQQRLQRLEEFMQFSGQGSSNAQHQAMELLTRQVDLQAALLAYGDVFRAIAVLFILAIPLVLLMGRASQPQAGEPKMPRILEPKSTAAG